MTDRELLEAAAKAAGLAVEWHHWPSTSKGALYILNGITGNPGGAGYDPWNPLTNDGDALRLAVRLRMCVEPWGSGAAAVVTVNNRALVAEPHYGDDPERATRRAIVRAAAAMAGQG